MSFDFHTLTRQLITEERQAALSILYTLDEEAVAPLIDQFYAGVSIEVGTAIIEVVSEIGGYEALAFLHDLHDNEPRWKAAAERGLNRN